MIKSNTKRFISGSRPTRIIDKDIHVNFVFPVIKNTCKAMKFKHTKEAVLLRISRGGFFCCFAVKPIVNANQKDMKFGWQAD